MTGKPAARRALTASMTRMTANGGMEARSAATRRWTSVTRTTLPVAGHVHGSADAPVLTTRAVEQASVDEVPAQGGDIGPDRMQHPVHIALRVSPAGLEELGDVLEDDLPTRAGAGHDGEPSVTE